MDGDDPELRLKLLASYAHRQRGASRGGRGWAKAWSGQCAFEKKPIHLTGVEAPEYCR